MRFEAVNRMCRLLVTPVQLRTSRTENVTLPWLIFHYKDEGVSKMIDLMHENSYVTKIPRKFIDFTHICSRDGWSLLFGVDGNNKCSIFF